MHMLKLHDGDMQAQQRAAEMRAARLAADRAASDQRAQEQAAVIDAARQQRLRRLASNQAATAQHLQVCNIAFLHILMVFQRPVHTRHIELQLELVSKDHL